MEVSGNSARWIGLAKTKGLDLQWLDEDKTAIYPALQALGLPFPAVYYIAAHEVTSSTVDALFATSDYFCRLIPRERGERPFRVRLRSAQEFREFCGGYDLSKYIINVVQRGDITHTGSIVARDEASCVPGRCIVEVVEGEGPDLFHGHKTPATAELDDLRIVRYGCKQPTDDERAIVYSALRWIGGPSHPFPGYYEFEVWSGSAIKFRNYQNQDSPYASLRDPRKSLCAQ